MENMVPIANAFEVPLTQVRIQPGFDLREKTKPDPNLVDQVKAQGVINPIHVRTLPKKKGFWVIDGHGRHMAAKAAGLSTIPVFNHNELNDSQALALCLTTKDQKPFTDHELAAAIIRLSKDGYEEQDIIDSTGLSQRRVREALRVMDSAIEAVKKADTSLRVKARAATLDAETQEKIAKDLEGKNRHDGLQVVRNAEKESKKKVRGRKALEFPLAKKPQQTLFGVQKMLNEALRFDKKNPVIKGQLAVVDVMKGAATLEHFASDFGYEYKPEKESK